MKLSTVLIAVLVFAAALLAPRRTIIAQDAAPVAGAQAETAQKQQVDIITPHITDSHHLEVPFVGEV